MKKSYKNKHQIQKTHQPKNNKVTVTTYVARPKRIFDKKDLKNIGILFWKQETLEEITKLSGPLATANEYQIHYWSLVARQKFADGSIIDIAFPTAIFNYEQEVSGSHIDFELQDVKDISEAIKPVHNVVTNSLLPQLQAVFKDAEFIEVPMNTMHRHPTGVSSFSGTDLKKDHEQDTGIVFPLQSANEDPSFSSIIYNNPVSMVHSEYRIATGNTEEESGIHYREGRCTTYVKGKVSTPSGAEQMIGIKPIDQSYTVTKDSELSKLDLSTIVGTIDYTPNTQFVKKENLKKKTYTVFSYFNNTPTVTNKTKSTTPVKPQVTDPVLVFDPDQVAEIKREVNVDIKNFVDLQQANMHMLKIHCLGLERYYYQDQDITLDEYISFKKIDLIDHALELQGFIIDEYYSTPFMTNDTPDINNVVDDNPVLTDQDYFDFMGHQFSDEDEYYYTYGKQAEKTFEEKIKDLTATGMKERALHNASPETINRWHAELTQ